MSYVPRFQPQLGRGTPVPGATQGSRDCGPRTVQMGIDALTHGDLRPDIPEIRDRMDCEGPQVTNVLDAERCVESYDHVPHRKPLGYGIKRTVAELKSAVSNDKYVQVCLDYGTFNRVAFRTGDPNFTEGHSVGVKGQRRRADGTIMWLLFDPLDDGRRDEIPVGPRWVPREWIVKAAEAFVGGQGAVWAGVFTGGQEKGR